MKPYHALSPKMRYLGLSFIAAFLAFISPLAAQRVTAVHDFDALSTPTGVTFNDEGDIYGVSGGSGVEGDEAEFGGVYKLTPSGDFDYIFYFTGTAGAFPGANPRPALLFHNGAFYGTATSGGNNNGGVLFRINADDSYEVLHHFTFNTFPNGTLTVGPGGSLYAGFDNLYGGIYKIDTDGTDFEVLFTFTHTTGPYMGRAPDSSKLLYTGGYLYGTTVGGGEDDRGIVYRFDSEGNYEVLGDFSGGSGSLPGSSPQAGLMLASDGNMYGTTYGGGSENRGTIFRVTPAGVCTSIASGTVANAVFNPYGRLTQKGNWLYGVDYVGGTGGGSVFRVSFEGVIESLFYLNLNTGVFPLFVTLAEGPDGNLYGTTLNSGQVGFGAIYRLNFPAALRVRGNDTNIANEDETPSEDDHTYFEQGVTERVFTLSNFGLENLTISSVAFTGTGADQFTYDLASSSLTPETGDPATPTPNTELTITHDPSGGDGAPVATVTITYTGGATFTFDIEALGFSEPTISLLPAAPVRGYSATLNAEITPNGLETTYFFEYSTDPTLTTGVTTTPTGTLPTQDYTAAAVSAAITGLIPETAYYYRVTATNDEDTVVSDIESFTSSYPISTGEIFATENGFPAGGSIYRPTPGVINNAGNILFQTVGLAGSGAPPILGTDDEWLISDASGAPRIILREGDSLGSNQYVSGLFNHLLLGNSGQSFISEKLAGATTDKDYAYIAVSPETEGIQIISQEGDDAPDGGVFINSVGKPALDGEDRLYFQGSLSGVPTAIASGAWYDEGDGVLTLVQAGQDISTLTGDPAWLGKVSNILAAGGDGASFVAALQANPADTKQKTDTLRNQAILSANIGEEGVELSLIARKGDVIEGTGGGIIQNITAVSRSENEDHAFVALMKIGTGAVDKNNDEVLATVVDGESVLVAREGSTELVEGFTPKSFGDFHVTLSGDVIFQAVLKDAVATNDNILCRWLAETGEIQVLAREGDEAPGTGGLNYGTIQAVNVSSNGNIALQSILSDGKIALFRDLGEGFELIAKSGPGNTISYNGSTRTIVSLSIYAKNTGTGGGGGGMGSAINDDGHVFAVLSLGSGDYVARIYRDTPPPPEVSRQANP